MKKLLLLFILFPLLSFSQNIKGKVISMQNSLPIQDVNIKASNFNNFTLTNEDGEFKLKLPSNFKENDNIEFSHIGFTTLIISLADLKKTDYKVTLSEEIENLSGLTINKNSKRNLNSKLSFNKLSPLKYGVFSFGSQLIGNKIYVSGGNTTVEINIIEKLKAKNINTNDRDFVNQYLRELNSQPVLFNYIGEMEIYDIKTDTWQTAEQKFRKRAYHTINSYANNLYIMGGKRLSDNGKVEYLDEQIEVLDLNKNTILIDKTNPHQAINFSSYTYKDNIIVIGGSIKSTEQGRKVFTNKVHLYNITSGLWYQLEDMKTAKEANGVLVNDKIYLIGGNNGKPITEIESFDLINDKWQTEGQLFSSLEYPAITSNGTTIYIFGKGKINVYNTISKELKEYFIDLDLKSSSMHFYNNVLYIIGGYSSNNANNITSPNTYSISVDQFDNTKPNRVKILASESLAKISQ